MADLLRAALRRGLAAVFVRELLAAFAPSRVAAPPRGGDAPEPLSERELDVLRLLRTDLDGPAIADELMVSLNTLRTHTRKIYEKLGVNSRRAAVRRAEELNLAGRRSGR
jgi:LuxR family maltose regulon positive regulatory protein